MSNLEKLKKEVLEDGVIDAEEVKQIEKLLYEDETIDDEEAEFMFELNDAVSGNANHKSWEDLFIRSICDYLLEDETSPGEIDDEEAKWLYDKISGDGQVDELEKQLLISLREKAKSFPKLLSDLL